jgi:hypothetical protein
MRPNQVIALLGCALIHLSAGAQDARLQGVFVNPTQSEQPIKTAIDGAAKEFNFLLRPIARSRLTKTNPNITRVAIMRIDDDITIQVGTSKPATARPNGTAVKWSRNNEQFDLALVWEGMILMQSFTAPDGKRCDRYALSRDGNSLALDVTITSDDLKQPMKYSLVFKREGSP